MRADSLISKSKRCYVCGTTQNLHLHHIYMGANRKNSDKIGAWVYLCCYHHNGSSAGVHYNHKLDQELKIKAQEEYEKTHTREDFMKIIKRNYLD
jgi:hypothetical protein